MRPPHHILDRRTVHRLAAEHLQAHLGFRDYKRKCSARVLWSLLLAAATRITSLSDACQRLDRVPSDETARKALLATLPDYATLQRQLNAALAGHLPKALRRRLQRLAIDLTLIPYHGRPFRELSEIYRSQAKNGTSHFHAYATAYVVRKGQRFTVALTGVRKGEPLKDVVQRLLRQAACVGVRPRLLLLDRGFYSVAVVRYLQQARYPFLMPVVCHGRSPRQPGGPTGSYVFRTWKTSGWSRYTLTEAKTGHTATVSIGVQCRNRRRGARPSRPRSAGVRLLGLSAGVAGGGVHNVPVAVWDRDELSPDARGSHPDDDTAAGGAALVRGDRAGAEEPLGMAALRGPLAATSGRSGDPAGAAVVGHAVALVAPCGGGNVRGQRCHLHRKRHRI